MNNIDTNQNQKKSVIKSMPLLNPQTWKSFQLQELFELKKGKRLTKANMKEGKTPFIGSIDSNNGVSSYVGQAAIHLGETITVSYNGSVAEAFYQPEPFWASDDVNVLYPKFKITPEIGLFLCALIRQEKYRFNYGRKWHLDRMNVSTIKLPVTSAKKPDWAFMDGYIKSLPFSYHDDARKPALDVSPSPLNTNKWKPFELQQLFYLKKGQRLTKANMAIGDTPYIGSTDSNNGITARVGQKAIHAGGTISVAYNGSVAETFFQPVPFWATDDVNVLYPKFKITPEIGLFLCALIRQEKYRFNYGRKWHLERMNVSTINLPVTISGKPDLDFMETYIKSLPYSSKIQ